MLRRAARAAMGADAARRPSAAELLASPWLLSGVASVARRAWRGSFDLDAGQLSALRRQLGEIGLEALAMDEDEMDAGGAEESVT